MDDSVQYSYTDTVYYQNVENCKESNFRKYTAKSYTFINSNSGIAYNSKTIINYNM